jgi:ATP-dependent exoDNAse (exonuclease V) alpha subunit
MLAGPELRVGEVAFARSDRVVVKRNDARVGVTNGERGVVVAVDLEQQRLAVRLGHDVVTLDHGFLANPTRHGDSPLTHGYAITCHVAQGVTVDQAFVLADDSLTSELGYTAMSRGQHRNDLYLADRRTSRARSTRPPKRPTGQRSITWSPRFRTSGPPSSPSTVADQLRSRNSRRRDGN